MNWILKFISALIFFPPCIKTQQKYSGTATFNCKPSEYSLYKCNAPHSSSCTAFLIFKAKSPFDTLAAITALTSSNITLLSQINHLDHTPFTVLPQGQQLIVPVKCSCPRRQHYEAITTYLIPSPSNHQTFFTIANDTYQGLSTCDSLKHANTRPGSGCTIRVPLRCACPTREQAAVGTKFLLTYSINRGDTLFALSKRFNVSVKSICEANSLSDELSTIYPFTTILIPLQKEPSHLQTYNNPTKSPLPPHFPKRRSNILFLAVGISTGLFSLLLLLLIIFLFKLRQRRRKATPQDLINLEIARLDRALKEFKFYEIKKATRNFASKRRVHVSSVYRGTFKKEVLAVKKSRGEAYHTEMKILYKINHFNIMKLHGFCEHRQDLYLVYEYMANGSLEEWLRSNGAMSWKQRISIALDVANGLLYLHSFANPAYAHNDVRSCNILLDGNLRARISHFGLAHCNGSPKVDVFGLGIVLLELITDKYEAYGNKETLLSTTVGAIMEGQNAVSGLSRFIGHQLAENGGLEYAVQMVKLSLSCLVQDPEDRPDMAEVVSFLLKMQSNMRINQFIM